MIVIFLVAAILVAVPLALAAYSVRLEGGSTSQLAKRQAAPALAAELPWWAIEEDGALVGIDLRYSFILSLVGVDVDCMADEDLEHLQQQIHGSLSQ